MDIVIEIYKFVFDKDEKKGNHLYQLSRVVLVFLFITTAFACILQYYDMGGLVENKVFHTFGNAIQSKIYHGAGRSWDGKITSYIRDRIINIHSRSMMFRMIYILIGINVCIRLVYIQLSKKDVAFNRTIEKGMKGCEVIITTLRDLGICWWGSVLIVDSIGVILAFLTEKSGVVPFQYNLFVRLMLLYIIAQEIGMAIIKIRERYACDHRRWQWSGFFDINDSELCYGDLVIYKNRLFIIDKAHIVETSTEEWIIRRWERYDDKQKYPILLLREKANKVKIFEKNNKRCERDDVPKYKRFRITAKKHK